MSFIENCDAIDEAEETMFRIYPNPATDVIHIEGLENGSHQLFVYDMLGKVVASAMVSDNVTDINISHLPEGVYVVKFIGETGQTNILKICKK